MIPAPPKKVPTACIRREHQSRWGMCGREHYLGEFQFDDPGHAVKFYRDCWFLRACPACIEVVELNAGWR